MLKSSYCYFLSKVVGGSTPFVARWLNYAAIDPGGCPVVRGHLRPAGWTFAQLRRFAVGTRLGASSPSYLIHNTLYNIHYTLYNIYKVHYTLHQYHTEPTLTHCPTPPPANHRRPNQYPTTPGHPPRPAPPPHTHNTNPTTPSPPHPHGSPAHLSRLPIQKGRCVGDPRRNSAVI